MQAGSARSAGSGLAVLLAGLVLAGSGLAGPKVSDAKDASKPFIVKIHADWCGTCQHLVSTFKALEKKLGKQTRIVILDVTDRQSTRAAYAEAKRLGILDWFKENQARTGTVAVMRGDTRAPVKILKGETDVALYEAAVKEARGSS